ncbi:hypothetical protein K2X33_03525 [bacterium]|nr:hypothetical protein [bacterium]
MEPQRAVQMNPPGNKVRVIDSGWTLFVAVLVIGPLALPLLWRNPRFGRMAKIWISVAVIALTVFLIVAAGYMAKYAADSLAELNSL